MCVSPEDADAEVRQLPLAKRAVAALRTPQGWVALIATALVGWAISYFLPKLFESSPPQFSVEVQSNSDRQIQPRPTAYAIPRPIGKVGAPPVAERNGPDSALAESCGERYEWAHAMGGADLEETVAEVVLTGGARSSVTVQGDVHVLKRRPLFTGSVLNCLGRGDGLSPLAICVDLVLERLSFCPHGAKQKKPFARVLEPNEVEVLELIASAQPPIAEADGPAGIYEWTAELDIDVSGSHHHYVIDDEGKPFRTYSTGNFAQVEEETYVWTAEGWQKPASATGAAAAAVG